MSSLIPIHKAILHGARDLRWEVEDVSLLTLGDRELFVETEISALSTGTDLANYDGRSREVPGAPDYPRWVGYNNVGVVRHCGPAVTEWSAGDRVFAPKPHQSGYVAKDTDLLVRVPDGVTPEMAALAYLTNLGVSALRQARFTQGERVCVVGLGVIGLCTVAVARAMGARVTAVANAEPRRELALRLGAAEVWAAGEGLHDSADVVVLTANTWAAYRESVDLCGYLGRIAVLGFPGRAQASPDFNPLDMQWLYGKQLSVAGAGHCPAQLRRPQLEAIFDHLRTGRMDLAPAITHRVPWRDMAPAYELALTHSKAMAGVIFDWR